MKVVDTGRLACLILSTALVVQVSGCQKPANNSQQAQQQAPPAQQQQQQLPEGHPPMGGAARCPVDRCPVAACATPRGPPTARRWP